MIRTPRAPGIAFSRFRVLRSSSERPGRRLPVAPRQPVQHRQHGVDGRQHMGLGAPERREAQMGQPSLQGPEIVAAQGDVVQQIAGALALPVAEAGGQLRIPRLEGQQIGADRAQGADEAMHLAVVPYRNIGCWRVHHGWCDQCLYLPDPATCRPRCGAIRQSTGPGSSVWPTCARLIGPNGSESRPKATRKRGPPSGRDGPSALPVPSRGGDPQATRHIIPYRQPAHFGFPLGSTRFRQDPRPKGPILGPCGGMALRCGSGE